MAWRDGFHAQRGQLVRLPASSDFAIQHVVGVEGFDPRKMTPSASVRYTTRDSWLFIKGDSIKVNSVAAQCSGLARQLVSGHLSHNFAGASHCSGCSSIKAAARGTTKGLGNKDMLRRLVTFDCAMKRLLGSKANFQVLEGFLSALFNEVVTILELLESERKKDASDATSSRLDLKVRLRSGEIVLTEIKATRVTTFVKRALFSVSKAVTEPIDQRPIYEKIPRVISVNIFFFPLGRGLRW